MGLNVANTPRKATGLSGTNIGTVLAQAGTATKTPSISLERQFAKRVAELGLDNPATVKALGEMANKAVESGKRPEVVQAALREAVRSTGGEAGEATFIRLLAKVGTRAIPGVGLVLIAFDVANAMDVGTAGGGKLLNTEERIRVQNTLRRLLLEGDPQQQLLGVITGSPGALLELAQAQTRYAEPNTLAALRKGLPLLAKLAAAGAPEARQTLQTLTRAQDGGLASSAKTLLRSPPPSAKAPRRPVTPVQAELPPNPGLQPLPPIKVELPRLKTDPKAQAADHAGALQRQNTARTAFLERLKDQDQRSEGANNAMLGGWVRNESGEQLEKRVRDIAKLLKGNPVGNVYQYHTDANGKPVPESRNPNYNQYNYEGVLLKVSDLNYLRTSLERYVATLKKAQTPAPGTLGPTGARVESPGKTLTGQAARDREAELFKEGKEKATRILETLTPSPWSSQTYEQMLADAIASSQSDPYTAFWLAQLGQRIKPIGTSPTAGTFGGEPTKVEPDNKKLPPSKPVIKSKEARDADYISRTDHSIAISKKIDWDHVLNGHINPKGWPTGYHFESEENKTSRIVPGAHVQQNQNGTYSAPVEIWDDKNKIWVAKKQITTFFPKNWSRARIEYEVSYALKNARPNEGREGQIGHTTNGINIIFHWDATNSRTTFFPLYK
jgi:Bacterial EndoU nuclease